MNWCELISGIYETRGKQPGYTTTPKFYSAASLDEIDDVETRINARFPTSLRSLLLETNGVMEMMMVAGGEWFDSQWLIWTVTDIIEQNSRCRGTIEEWNSTHDLRRLVFFAGAGCDGILFGSPVNEDDVCESRVVVWWPMRDEVREVAPSLEDFLSGWLTGRIAV